MDKNFEKKLMSSSNDENQVLSTDQILREIKHSVNQEKERRTAVKKKNSEGVLELGEKALIKRGIIDFDSPMSEDLATLKGLIQTIVRQELSKLEKDRV